MKCPNCENHDMEKAQEGDKYFCRKCGHSETSISKDELITKVAELEKKLDELTKKKKEKEPVEEPW